MDTTIPNTAYQTPETASYTGNYEQIPVRMTLF